MDKILEYIKTVPHENVAVEIREGSVKVVWGFSKVVYDLFTIEEFEEKCARL